MAKPVTEPFKVEDCAICLETLGKVNVSTTKCGHTFHFDCLRKHNKNTCPNCRAELYESKEPIVVNDAVINNLVADHQNAMLDLMVHLEIANQQLHAQNVQLHADAAVNQAQPFQPDIIGIINLPPNQAQLVQPDNIGIINLPPGHVHVFQPNNVGIIGHVDIPPNLAGDWYLSGLDRIIQEFKETEKWRVLTKDVIIKLFRESKDNMMLKSLESIFKNRLSYDNIHHTHGYDPHIRDLITHCLENLVQFYDITELIECAIKYDTNERHVRTYYPNIYSLTKKYIQQLTYRKLMQTPQIQEQLKDPQTVKKCREFLKDSVLLNVFNEYVPGSCIVM